MAISFVQQVGSGTTGTAVTTKTVTWASNTTSGNFIALAINLGTTTATITSVTDSQSNTYTRAIRSTVNNAQEIWYASNIVGGTTPTVTVNLSSSIVGIQVAEYSGVAISSPLDGIATGNGTTGTSIATSAVTTTVSNELLFVTSYSSGSGTVPTAGSGYLHGLRTTYGATGSSSSFIEDMIVSSTGAYIGTVTLSAIANWQISIATFIASSTPPSLTGISSISGISSITF